MKARFYELLTQLIDKKKSNNTVYKKIEYDELIEKVLKSKGKIKNKKPDDYQRLKRYDVKIVGFNKYLIHPASGKIYVYFEDLFQIIDSIHTSLSHSGRDRMIHEINKKYRNVTVEQIMVYLRLCQTCQQKSKLPKKGLVVRPMIFNEMNSRCQIDLIDMQSSPDNGYRFIFVYQDHLTKFVQLRPLTSKRAEEVAHVLLDVFTILGAPCVLQSDNGEFYLTVCKQ